MLGISCTGHAQAEINLVTPFIARAPIDELIARFEVFRLERSASTCATVSGSSAALFVTNVSTHIRIEVSFERQHGENDRRADSSSLFVVIRCDIRKFDELPGLLEHLLRETPVFP